MGGDYLFLIVVGQILYEELFLVMDKIGLKIFKLIGLCLKKMKIFWEGNLNMLNL